MRTILLASAAVVALAGAAHADITFKDSNTGGIGEVNILFGATETGTTITGEVDHSGISAIFSTLTGQTLSQPAKGQALISCAAGCIDNSPPPGFSSQLNSIEMKAGTNSLGQATAWTDVILNDENGTGTALITATDNFSHTFTDVLKSGQNFVTLIATPGTNEFITAVTVTNDVPGAAFGFDEFKQPRVSGTCVLESATSCVPVTIVPEPAGLAVLGVGLLGLGLGLGRRKFG